MSGQRTPSPPRTFEHSVYYGVLIFYIVGISASNREFARLHFSFAGTPLFVGEVTIGILLGVLLLLTLRERRLPIRVDAVTGFLLVYMLLGGVFAISGLVSGYGLAALRDYALVYYLLFFFLASAFIRRIGRSNSLIMAMVVGASLGSGLSVLRFLISTELIYGHAASISLALVAWVSIVYLLQKRQEATGMASKVLITSAVIACALTIFLSSYRTFLVVIPASLVLLWVITLRSGPSTSSRAMSSALLTTVVVGALAILIAAPILVWGSPPEASPRHGSVSLVEALQIISERWLQGIGLSPSLAPSTVVQPTEEYTIAPPKEIIEEVPDESGTIQAEPPQETGSSALPFRFAAWRNALDRVALSPLLGIGFGPAPSLHPEANCLVEYSPTSNCGNAHNTFLTLAMRMGIPIFLFFVAINGLVLVQFLPSLRSAIDSPQANILPLVALMAYVSFALFAFTSLFFESPYHSSRYWIVLAVMHHIGSGHHRSDRSWPSLVLNRLKCLTGISAH